MNLAITIKITGGHKVEVNEDLMLSFGRDPSADLQINDGQTSKIHGEFYVMDGQLFIRDLGSRNGTYVNGQRIEGSAPLNVGDMVHLGKQPIFKMVSPGSQLSSGRLPKVKPLPPMDMEETIIAHQDHHDFQPQALTKKGDMELASQPLALKKQDKSPAPVMANKQPESHENSLLKKPIMLVLVAVVGLLVAFAAFGKKSEPVAVEQFYGEKQYLADLKKATLAFMDKDYPLAIATLEKPILKFNENGAAHILSSISELWRDKGDKYEKLPWHKAENLSEELLNIHPTHPTTTRLAQNLFAWIKKEEPNMAKLQEILLLASQNKWDLAQEKLSDFPTDSRFRKTHELELLNVSEQFHKQHHQAYINAVENQRWSKAISELEAINRGEHPMDNASELMKQYRSYILHQAQLQKAKQALDKNKFPQSKAALTQIPEESPYHANALELLNLIEPKIHQKEKMRLYHGGSGREAIAYSRQHLPDDSAFVTKVEKILDLINQGNSALLGTSPERCVESFKQVLQLEPTDHNHYRLLAQKNIRKWSSSDTLAGLYLQRGKDAELNNETVKARDFYLKANQLDESIAQEEIKAFEKKAYQHFNRAMSYAIKEDMHNVKIYLKKALELTAPKGKLYDRIESYARRNIKE